MVRLTDGRWATILSGGGGRGGIAANQPISDNHAAAAASAAYTAAVGVPQGPRVVQTVVMQPPGLNGGLPYDGPAAHDGRGGGGASGVIQVGGIPKMRYARQSIGRDS